jgi:hypothetical protein
MSSPWARQTYQPVDGFDKLAIRSPRLTLDPDGRCPACLRRVVGADRSKRPPYLICPRWQRCYGPKHGRRQTSWHLIVREDGTARPRFPLEGLHLLLPTRDALAKV